MIVETAGGVQIADSSAALTAALDPCSADAVRDCAAANTSSATVLTSAITTATIIERADCGFVDLLMGMRPDHGKGSTAHGRSQNQ